MTSHSRLTKSENNVCGWRFSQQDLSALNYINVTAGKQPIFKLISITNIILFNAISGSVAGLVGSLSFLEIAIHSEKFIRFSYLCNILVFIIWLQGTFRKSLIHGFITSFLGIFLLVVIASLWAAVEGFNDFIFAGTFIALSFLFALDILSFFTGCFSSALSKICLSYRYKILKIVNGIFVSVIAQTIAQKFAFSDYFTSEFLEPAYNSEQVLGGLSLYSLKVIAVGCGTLFGVTIATVVFLTNQFESKTDKHLGFVWSWAIAVGSWGGTSFYNLDLSNVNFRNAKLANTDLRARKLYRTCFQGVQGLERARVDSRYLDLENPKVQKLLTQTPDRYSGDKDFSQLNLRGAYLQNADMRGFNLTDTDLIGADLRGADLRDSIMVGTKVIGVDFTGAKLTGACIQDWSVNSQTVFTNVECDRVYRKLDENGERTDPFPVNRNFEPKEFESLYKEVENVVELIFPEGDNWQAALFTIKKLQLEDENLGLELKGVEKRGDLWVVKLTYNESYLKQEVEQRVNAALEEIKHQLAAKEREINQLQYQRDKLLGIAADQAAAWKDQAAALERLSRQPFGNSFVIMGSAITNLVGSGQIDYDEASNKIRSIVANGSDPSQVTTAVQSLLEQFQSQGVATTSDQQAELIQQLILAEAQKNPEFQQFFAQQGQQIADAVPEGAIATAIKKAIAQLS